MKSLIDYSKHLNRTSRSFAFCIRELPSPERQWVGLGYLLCRIADTIEDSKWSSPQTQSMAFDGFLSFIQQPVEHQPVQTWIQLFPSQGIPRGERLLLEDAHYLFKDLHALPLAVREALKRPILSMTRGMRAFQLRAKESSDFEISNLKQLDQYCFFVAGLVGELLTKLMAQAPEQSYSPNSQDYLRSIHFGLYLQKINILKDWASDRKEGREFIANPEKLLPSLLIHAKEAFNYILELPVEMKGYRRFCAWSFFIGLATLPYSAKSWAGGGVAKLPKLKALLLIERVARECTDNLKLTKLYQELSSFLEDREQMAEPGPALLSRQEFFELYEGKLKSSELVQLGLLSPEQEQKTCEQA